MPGRQPEDWGIPLWEAIERWTPRELWERYRELAEFDIPLIIPGAEDPRSEEVRRLRSGITEVLVDRLARGELIASGIAVPLKETSRRRDIRPELWCCLAFSFGFSMVTGNGLRYSQILIREASSVRGELPASRSQVSPRRPPARPGRPSIMPMIEAEMRRRAESGQLASSMRQEARDLAAWAEQGFHGSAVPKARSIEKRLGATYRELVTTNSADK